MSEICKEATLTRSLIGQASTSTLCLRDFLTHVHVGSGGDVRGLAFATNGTWPVLGFAEVSSAEAPKLSVSQIEGRDFEEEKVFELRLWVPTPQAHEPTDGEVLAHEFRWVNSVGAVELRLAAGTGSSQPSGNEDSGDRGWVHAVQYLKHVPSSRSTTKPGTDSTDNESNQSGGGTGASHMTALEFIQAENKYGNTVVVDQLFTGEWQNNA